ncbi:hypothetical protein E2C01_039630 [Portunus trituberculatus]|uniref:Uncharacterized protein n=1 Tax=Portunus trituberculatus TaxID=210409 RepID=A0A5B7FNI4_PORTR|nr:hypothetical protein [Portunus trituberculatus]
MSRGVWEMIQGGRKGMRMALKWAVVSALPDTQAHNGPALWAVSVDVAAVDEQQHFTRAALSVTSLPQGNMVHGMTSQMDMSASPATQEHNICDEKQAVAHSTQEAAQAGSAGGGNAAKIPQKIPSFCEQNKGEAASYTPLAHGAAGLKLRDEGNKRERTSGARNANLIESSICCGTQEGISGRTPTLIINMGGYTDHAHLK